MAVVNKRAGFKPARLSNVIALYIQMYMNDTHQ